MTFIASIDTMKTSRDTETRGLSRVQIAQEINLLASLNVTHITVDTHWEYADYAKIYVDAIRAVGKSVWFRMQPNQWGNNNGTTGIMTPDAFKTALVTFLDNHQYLFSAGDIFDAVSEPEQGTYFLETSKGGTKAPGWSYVNAPNPDTNEFNQFILDTSLIAFDHLPSGIITGIRSTNSWWASNPKSLYPATTKALGYVTIDSYPEETSVTPSTCTEAWQDVIEGVKAAHPGEQIVIGEMGYSNKVNVGDDTQSDVLEAELPYLQTVSGLAGVNYWVGPGSSTSGGYTHVLKGSPGSWALRPGATTLSSFFKSKQ